ncbi:LysR family substrate-binding domain-containing protein, partial [Ralstonia pseudosolanacearum]
RQEEPEIEIRLSEVPLSQQIKGLQDDLFDIGFAQSDEVGEELIAEPVWHDPLIVAVPARHPLLAYKHVPLEELLRYPLALGDSNSCEGHARQVERVLRRANQEPLIVERVASFDLMVTLVSAGFALGLAGASQIMASRDSSVIARPLAGGSHKLTTYLLRVGGEPSAALTSFIERLYAAEPPNGKTSAARVKHDPSENIEP